MDQYIKQLLLLHSKIILPQFGAIFIANEETGDLSFNEYLSYDDGKLSKLLEKDPIWTCKGRRTLLQNRFAI